MQLIVDSGSTKTEWVVLDKQSVIWQSATQGFNPNYMDKGVLAAVLRETFPKDISDDVETVHYYGSGCGAENNCQLVKGVLSEAFPKARISVTHDLMAAAHALFGQNKGIACILGTGANACVYDGKNIVDSAVSLGYLIGDEGSGTSIGKAVTRSYFYGFMPKDLSKAFDEQYHLTPKAFVDRLYHQPQPNSFISEFARFAGAHLSHPFIQTLCAKCFHEFIEAFVSRFDDYKKLEISFVGSVAFHFQSILCPCLEEKGLHLGKIIKSPLEGLVAYCQGLNETSNC